MMSTFERRGRKIGMAMGLGLGLLLSGGAFDRLEAAKPEACRASDLCASGADPCVIAKNYIVPAGCTFDFGNRDVVLQKKKTLTISGCDAPVRFLARNFTTQSSSVIDGHNAGSNCGADVEIVLSGDFVHQGKLDVSGNLTPGSITVSTQGSIEGMGKLFARATNAAGSGGVIDLGARGSIRLDHGSTIKVSGNSRGNGGKLWIVALGPVTINQAIDASAGGSFDVMGGDIWIESATSLQVGTGRSFALDVSAAGAAFGGEIDLISGGEMALAQNVTLNLHGGGGKDGFAGDGGRLTVESAGPLSFGALVKAQGGGAGDIGGYGGDIEITSYGDVEVTNNVNVFGGVPDGDGGDFTLFTAGNLFLDGKVDCSGDGIDSMGGSIDLEAEGTLTVTRPLDVSGKGFGAGDIDILASGDTSIEANLLSNGGGDGGDGGFIDIDATQANVTISALVQAIGDADGGWGGEIVVTGDRVTIDEAGKLDTRGDGIEGFAENVIEGTGPITIAGTMEAGNANKIYYGSELPLITGKVTPAPYVEPLP